MIRSGNVQHTSTTTKFGISSIFFDGSGDALEINQPKGLNLGTDSFSLDFWYKDKATITTAGILTADGFLVTSNGNNVYFSASTDGLTWDIANAKLVGTVSKTQFDHFAIERDGNTFRTYKNGIIQSTWTSTASLKMTTTLKIGQNGFNYLNGYLDEIRINKTLARWKGFFNTPTSAQQIYNLGELGTDCSGDVTVPNMPNGHYYLVVKAEDNAKNYTLINQAVVVNKTPNLPTINNLFHASTISTTSPLVNFNISDPDTGDTIKYQIQIDNNTDFTSPEIDKTESTGLTTPRNYVTYQSSSLTPGVWNLRIRTIDSLGTASEWKTISFTIDISEAPFQPVIKNHNDGNAYSSSNPSFLFDMSTPNAGTLVKYRVQVANNINFENPTIDYTETNLAIAPRNNINFSSANLGNGQWYWRVRAIDDLNRERDWTTAVNGFFLDTQLPTSKITYPQDQSNLKNVERIIVASTDNYKVNKTRISIYDQNSGKYFDGTDFVSNIEVWININNATVANSVQGDFVAPTWVNGHQYTIRSRAMDTAGNEEHTDSVTFTYDTINGQEGSVYVSNPAYMNNTDYKIYYPNTLAVPQNGYIKVTFPADFTFSPWMLSNDIVVSDSSSGITATSDLIDRQNRTITTTITAGSAAGGELIEIDLNNSRIHTPSQTGSYVINIELYDQFDALIESGEASILITKPYQQVQLNANVDQALQISVDASNVDIEVDPDVQLGQNWIGTGGNVNHKTRVEVKTNAFSGYNLLIKLNGNTADTLAVLDGLNYSGSQITSTAGDRISHENNFSFALNNSGATTTNAFQNTSTIINGAGLSTTTNSHINNIYYYLNVDYALTNDQYRGTIVYTAVGQF